MLVKFLVNTAYKGERKVGDTIDVDSATAQRWLRNKIAESAELEVAEVPQEAPESALSSLTAKQLYKMCMDKGIETKPKLAKDVYIALLVEAPEEASEATDDDADEGTDVEEESGDE
jgi:hypothetical protein